MKKVILFAAAVALTLASCGNKAQGNAPEADSTTTEVAADTTAAEAALSKESKASVESLTAELQKAIDAKDSEAAAATLTKLQTIYKNLVAEGKLEEAKAYGSAIKTFVNNNAETIKAAAAGNTTVATLVDGINNLPTSADATLEQAKSAVEAIQNAPANVKNAAENAAKTAVSNAKTAAEDKVNSEVNKGKEAVSNAKEAAKTKATNEVNKAKQKANDAVNNAANKALKGLGL